MALSREGERRRDLWLYEPFPALVRGVDVRGEAFESDTVLENFSAIRL